jgi:hypothetical protein
LNSDQGLGDVDIKGDRSVSAGDSFKAVSGRKMSVRLRCGAGALSTSNSNLIYNEHVQFDIRR